MTLTLLYHAVMPLAEPLEAGQRTLVIEPGELRWQFEELERQGFRTLTLDGFAATVEGELDGTGTVLLTFDDAYAHLLPTVTPLLEAHGFTAALFVPWAHAGATNDWDGDELPVGGLPIAGPAELRSAAAGPWEIASHGSRHVDLRALDEGQQHAELAAARTGLSELVGREVADLAYPYGFHDARVISVARETGHRLAFTSTGTTGGGRFALPRRSIRGQESRTAFKVKIDGTVGHLFG